MTTLTRWYDRGVDGAKWLHRQTGRPFRWLLTATALGRWIRRNTDPNGWSLIRLPLAVIISLLLYHHHEAWAIIVFGLALMTDRLDGEFARLDGRTSELGMKLDTLADGIMVVALLLGLGDRLPLLGPAWSGLHAGYIIVGLELVRLIGGSILSSEPNLSGKYKMVLVGLGIILALGGYGNAAGQVLMVGIFVSLYSMGRHVYDWRRHHRT